jgi:hypothetical protein
MADLLEDIALFLAASGIAPNENIFTDGRPDTIDNIVSLFEYPGPPTTGSIDILDRRVQVFVRNQSYTAAREQAWAIFNLLDRPKNREIRTAEGRWMICQALQQPYKLETDSHERTVFLFNIAVVTYRD